MRRSLIAALATTAMLAPVSLSAREPDQKQEQGGAAEVADCLHDPATQIAVTAMLATLSKSLLDLRVGDLARSAGDAAGDSNLRRIPPETRLRDLAGPDAERMERSIARGTPRMMGAMGNMADALDDMMPQLRAMARQMKTTIPRY